MRNSLAIAAMLAAAWALPANAADMTGSKDPAGFKRFQGSQIVGYSQRSYDAYSVALGPGTPGGGFAKSQSVEGAVTRVLYRVPAGHTALEVFRNYEAMLLRQRLSVSFKLDPCGVLEWARYFNGKFYLQAGNREPVPFDSADGSSCYLSAKAVKGGKQTTVALLVSEVPHDFVLGPPADKGQVTIRQGEILVGFDVVVGQPVADQMVVVRAAEMARQIAAKGQIGIYGILFDVDKATIKPDSKATLDEVALLLKGDPKLKLEIAGHTDASGNASHNDQLSQGRAEAVVRALIQNYGIAAQRLRAKGYGSSKPVAGNDTDDGRAKNRRVELRKI